MFSSRDISRLARNPRAQMAIATGDVGTLRRLVEQQHERDKEDEFRRFIFIVVRSGLQVPREHQLKPGTLDAQQWFQKNLRTKADLQWYNRILTSR